VSRASKPWCTVISYADAVELVGVPSDELLAASAAEESGAVPAYLDGEGVWQYVAPSQEDFVRRHDGRDVITVYVVEAPSPWAGLATRFCARRLAEDQVRDMERALELRDDED